MTLLDPPPAPDLEGPEPSGLRGLFRELGRRHVLRTAAWYVGASAALLQGADVFQQALGLPEGTVRFLAVAAVCGFPVALILSWAYNVTAEGADALGGWVRHFVVFGVVLGALVVGGMWLGRGGVPPAGPSLADDMPLDRVAILALDAPGSSAEGAAFAVYLHERLIEGLSAAAVASGAADSRRLRVISRAGTLPYSGGTFTTDSIGRALRSGTLVSGVVERFGTRLRVRLQLIDAASAEVLATGNVEAEEVDAIILVDAVADSLSRMVRVSLGPIVRERSLRLGTESQEAFEQFIRSRFWKDDSAEALEVRDLDRAQRSLAEADRALARAEELDPGWVEPVVRRGFLSYDAARLATAQGGKDLGDVFTRGLAHGERAVQLAPGDPRAHLVRGALRASLATGSPPPRNVAELFRGAEEDLRLATDSPRPADALRRLSELLAAEGRVEEALVYGQRAFDEDPYLESTAQSILRLFEYSFRLGRDEDAAEWCTKGRGRFPDRPFFEDCRLLLMAWSNVEAVDPDTAWAVMARELGSYTAALRPHLEPRLHALVAAVLARSGQADSARAVLGRAVQQDLGTSGVHLAAAGVEVLLGDRDRALGHVERALELAPGERARLAEAPELRGLRDVPAFRAIVGSR